MSIQIKDIMFSSFAVLIALFVLEAKSEDFLIHAHFNDGIVGQKAQTGESGDAFHGAAGQSTYSNEQVLDGKSAKLSINEGETGFGVWGGEFFYPNVYRGETIWFSVHTYFPLDFDHYSYGQGNRLKFLRIQTLTPENRNQGYNDFLIDMKGSSNPFKWIYEGQQIWKDVGLPKDQIVKGKWENYQMAVTFDTVSKNEGGLAEAWIWKNGILLEHITDRITLKNRNDYSNRALLFTYWNGGAPKTQSMYVDEIKITNIKPTTKGNRGFPMIEVLTNPVRPNPPSLSSN